YRSARQADALEAYRHARELLLDDLGLEPGEELKRLEGAILRQDPALDVVTPRREEPREDAGTRVADRAGLVAPIAIGARDAWTRLAPPLAMDEPPRALIVAGVVAADELATTTGTLALRREVLLAD